MATLTAVAATVDVGLLDVLALEYDGLGHNPRVDTVCPDLNVMLAIWADHDPSL
jgi:hypothetical protein